MLSWIAFKEQQYAGEDQSPIIKLHIKQLAVPEVELLAVTSAGDMLPQRCWPPAVEASSGFTNGIIAMYNEYVLDICSSICIASVHWGLCD